MSFERPSTKTPDKSLLPNVHIEGASHPDQETRLKKEIERRFVEQDHPALEGLRSAERPKTKEEGAIIDFANRASNALIKRYGGQPIDITPDQVLVLDKKRVPKSFEDTHGEFRPIAFGVIVKEQPGKYPLAATTFHEMLHAKSQNSYLVKENETDPLPKRVGISLNDKEGKGLYFNWLNEAVTEELAIEFIQACIKLKKWEEEIEETVQILKQQQKSDEKERLPEKDLYFARKAKKERSWFGFASRKAKDLPEKEVAEYYAYSTERQALKALVNFIYEFNKNEFKSKEEVFDVFARAMISGTLLPLGRLIERTFKKKTFRNLGALHRKEDLQKLTKNLETSLLRKQAME